MGRSWASMDEFETFLDDGGIVEVDDDMPDAYRTAVFRFIELHANSELMGGLTERDWIPRTPGLRHKMAVLAKTQDEIGHAHLLAVQQGRFRMRATLPGIHEIEALDGEAAGSRAELAINAADLQASNLKPLIDDEAALDDFKPATCSCGTGGATGSAGASVGLGLVTLGQRRRPRCAARR